MNLAPYIILIGSHPWSGRIKQWLDALADGGLETIEVDHDTTILVGAKTPYLKLPDRAGVVIGYVFSRMTNARRADLDDEPSSSIEDFLERYWGGYVACRRVDGCHEIWRDPSGEVPCYHVEIDGIRIATSRPSWLYDAGLFRPVLDWTVIAQALVFRDFRPPETALQGFSELLPGTCLTIATGHTRTHTIWSPWPFTVEDLEIRDAATAVSMLRETATECIAAWARCFDRPLLEVSGGLDSAIVAAGVRSTGRSTACLTFGPTTGDPDELPYAKAIGTHLEMSMRIETLSILDIDILRSHDRDLPRPCARNFSQALDHQLLQAAVQSGADAFFSGGGGDSLFGHLQSALPAIDRYKREGLGRGLLATIDDVAVLGRVTFWKALATVLRRATRPFPVVPTATPNRFVQPFVSTQFPCPRHPWLAPDPDALPAKRWHVWAMIGIYNYMEGFDRLYERPIVSPLMAQPLFELCMRIPMWLWCEGGINRAVARRAFADMLPREVIARPTKGAFDGFGAELIDRNRATLTDLLLNGVLAREGLIDRATLERSLGKPMPDGRTIVDVLTLADTEVWVRSWGARGQAQSRIV